MPFTIPKLPFKGCDPRRFLSSGRNVGKRFPAININNIRRDIENVQTTVDNIGDRLEGAIGAAKRGDLSTGSFVMSFLDLMCPPTHWASSFSQKIPPKFPFMYFTIFEVNADFIEAFENHVTGRGAITLLKDAYAKSTGRNKRARASWFVKQMTRPNITYEYEDINMYNFRTRVIRRMTYEPVTMTIYDDTQNIAHDFFNTYHRLISPIANVPRTNEIFYEQSGMNWDVPTMEKNINFSYDPSERGNAFGELVGGKLAKLGQFVGSSSLTGIGTRAQDVFASEQANPTVQSASIGALPGPTKFKNTINNIKNIHIINSGQEFAIYEYINPRITSIRFDELTWEDSRPSIIEVEFNYDNVDIQYSRGYTNEFVDKDMPFYPWQGAEQLFDGGSGVTGKSGATTGGPF